MNAIDSGDTLELSDDAVKLRKGEAPPLDTRKQQGDARLGDLLEEGTHGDVVFVLYPCDIGVKRNGGRVGARLGPARFLYFSPTNGIDRERRIQCKSLELAVVISYGQS